MNIGRESKGKNDTDGHNPMKHMLHMILCCGLPIVIILSLPFVARINPAIAGLLGIVAPFICPVMMGGMLFMMFGKKKSSCCDEPKTVKESNELSPK